MAAVFPAVHAVTAPIVCHAPYTHFVVHTNGFSYGNGITTGYTLNFTCANNAGVQRPVGGPGQIWLLWAFGWAASLVFAAIFHAVRVLAHGSGVWPAALVTLAATAAGIYALTTVPHSNGDYVAPGSHGASSPHPADLTTAPLPPPIGSARVSPSDPSSLFGKKGLMPVLRKLTTGFGANASVVQLAIYPGELEMVVTDHNDNARLVTASAGGIVTVGQPSPFSGSRQAVNLSQITARAIAEIEHDLGQARFDRRRADQADRAVRARPQPEPRAVEGLRDRHRPLLRRAPRRQRAVAAHPLRRYALPVLTGLTAGSVGAGGGCARLKRMLQYSPSVSAIR